MSDCLKVLIVDDDPIMVDVLVTIIEDLGHVAIGRTEALGTSSAILREQPDLVLLDLQMPALSGDQLPDLVRASAAQRGFEPRFAFVSGAEPAVIDEAVARTGAMAGIPKAPGPESVARALASLLRRIAAGPPRG